MKVFDEFRFSILMLLIKTIAGVRKATLNNVIYSSNPKYANASAIIWQQSEKSFINFSMETFEDLEKMIITLKMGFKTSKNSNSEISLMNTKINSCKLSEGNRGNPLVRLVMDAFEQCSDFNITCPFTKKKFHFSNYTPNEKLLIHSPFAGPMNYFSIDLKCEGKHLKNKKLVSLFTFKIFGIVWY